MFCFLYNLTDAIRNNSKLYIVNNKQANQRVKNTVRAVGKRVWNAYCEQFLNPKQLPHNRWPLPGTECWWNGTAQRRVVSIKSAPFVLLDFTALYVIHRSFRCAGPGFVVAGRSD